MHTLHETTPSETPPVHRRTRKVLTMGDKSPKQQKKAADQKKTSQGAKDQKRKDAAPVSGATKPKGK